MFSEDLWILYLLKKNIKDLLRFGFISVHFILIIFLKKSHLILNHSHVCLYHQKTVNLSSTLNFINNNCNVTTYLRFISVIIVSTYPGHKIVILCAGTNLIDVGVLKSHDI